MSLIFKNMFIICDPSPLVMVSSEIAGISVLLTAIFQESVIMPDI